MRKWLAGHLIRLAHRINRPTVTEARPFLPVIVDGCLTGDAADLARRKERMRLRGLSWN